ncbi:MAG: DEAD/DEAH box helicase [Deltaproteobacteria bacterium]|nr:DEAD/DEAH box helicase [Deltaproteobacteria bacterium]
MELLESLGCDVAAHDAPKLAASLARVDELFDRVREEAAKSAWSRGVELARSDAVTREGGADGEEILRVRPSTGVIHPTVVLYVEDAEWECDCPGGEDPCEHVAASVIALRRAAREGKELPNAGEGRSGGRIVYRLSRTGDGLGFERFIVDGESERRLETTLTALATGRVEGPAVGATQADLAVERALGTRHSGPMPRGVMRSLLAALEGCAEVELDGEPILPRREPVVTVVRLTSARGGFRLQSALEPAIEEEFGAGFVRCGDEIRELAPSRLTGREAEELGRGRTIDAEELPELLANVLPDLESRVEIRIETDALPDTQRVPPRLVLETERQGDKLAVLPLLVYGDPPMARVDAGRLVHLGGAVPIRDEAQEKRLTERLRTSLGLAVGHRSVLDAASALELVPVMARLATVRGEPERIFHPVAGLDARLEIDDDRVSLHFDSQEGQGQASAEAVLSAWRRGRSLVPLEGGGFAPLPADWLARYGRQVADLLAARDADGRVTPAVLPDLGRLCVDLDQPPPPSLEPLLQLLEGPGTLPEAPLPADLRGELRDYQKEGTRWLAFLRKAGLGGLLADDMGLGKTLQALCAIGPGTLVIAPTSLLANWEEEIQRFRPGLSVRIYHGAGRSLEGSADVTLTTYALLRRDRESLTAHHWQAVILDEAQAIKNPSSQVAQAAYQLRADQRITLTGTPVENRLEELWSQLHFLNPGLLGGRRDFEERYAGPIGDGDEAALEHLRMRLRPFVLRRKKSEVAPELPPRTEMVLHCVLSEEERAVYDAVLAATRNDVVQQLQGGGNVLAALEALLRLRQACCHPQLLPGQSLDVSAKLALLSDRLETAVAEGHKALVFSQWTSLLDLVEPRLREAGLGFTRLDGSTRDRGAVVREFSASDGPPIFLISLRAGGTGLNLTAADHVFLLDPWWNPAVEAQAADRAHRIGQERPVFIHRMVAENTVEERILALQDKKRELADAALSDAGAAGRITREDLLALLA